MRTENSVPLVPVEVASITATTELVAADVAQRMQGSLPPDEAGLFMYGALLTCKNALQYGWSINTYMYEEDGRILAARQF